MRDSIKRYLAIFGGICAILGISYLLFSFIFVIFVIITIVIAAIAVIDIIEEFLSIDKKGD